MSLLIYFYLPQISLTLHFIDMCFVFLIPKSQNDVSALHYAAKNGYPQLVTFLIEEGAFEEITDKV